MARLRAALENDIELVDEERVAWCRKELDRVTEDADPRAYWRQATWRRITAIVAGPAANVIAAFVDPGRLLRRSASPSTCRRPPCNQVQVELARRSAWASSPAMS